MSDPDVDDEPPQSVELSDVLLATHAALLARFAAAKPNALRGEIRRYCALLRRLAEWAGESPSLWQLAHRARWWEWHWFEREFGDSQFVPFVPPPEAEQEQYEFNRRHVALLAPTLPLDELGQELGRVAVGGTRLLPILSFLRPEASLLDFRFLLENVTPLTRRVLMERVERVATVALLSEMTVEFLDLLSDLEDSFAIRWLAAPASIEITRLPDHTIIPEIVVEGTARLWVDMQEYRRDELVLLHREATIDMADFLDELQERLVA